jgi:hypothetical protein
MLVLESDNKRLQEELNKSTQNDSSTMRTLQQAVEKSEIESKRTKEKADAIHMQLEGTLSKLAAVEKELAAAEEIGFQRDQTIRQERNKVEAADLQIVHAEECRARAEGEASILKQLLIDEQERTKTNIQQHEIDVERVRKQSEDNFKQLLASTIESLQKETQEDRKHLLEEVTRLENELKSTKEELKEVQIQQTQANPEKQKGNIRSREGVKTPPPRQPSKQALRYGQGGEHDYPKDDREGSLNHSQYNFPPVYAEEPFASPVQRQINPTRDENHHVRPTMEEQYDSISDREALSITMSLIQGQLLSLKQHLAATLNLSNTNYPQNQTIQYSRLSSPFNSPYSNSRESFMPMSHTNSPARAKIYTGAIDAREQQLRWHLENKERRIRDQLRSFHTINSSQPTYGGYSSPPYRYHHPITPYYRSASLPREESSAIRMNRNQDWEPVSTLPERMIELQIHDDSISQSGQNISNRSHMLQEMGITNEESLLSSDFHSIYDGGYHPGYWRAKYMS